MRVSGMIFKVYSWQVTVSSKLQAKLYPENSGINREPEIVRHPETCIREQGSDIRIVILNN